MRRPTSRVVTSLCATVFALSAAACSEKVLTPHSPGVVLHVAFKSQVASSRSVNVRVSYVTAAGPSVSIVDQETAVAPGTPQVSVAVDISKCLADASHIGGPTTCRLKVQVELRDGAGGTLLDAVELPLIDASPGTASSPAAVTLAAVNSITVTGNGGTYRIGETAQLSAAVRDASGNALVRTVTWSSANASVARVDSLGRVTAVGAGSTTIAAAAGGTTGSTSLTVLAPVASVSVAPATSTVETGKTVQLVATTRDASGSALTGRAVTFVSSASNIATVSSSGVVTGVTAGVAVITATSEGRTGSATITVINAPLVSLSTTSLSQIHTFGVSSCPQVIGTVTLTSLQSSGITTWTASKTHAALTLSTAGGTIAANGTAQLGISFNCAQATSFQSAVTVTASNAAGISEQRTINVTLTVVVP